MIDSVWVVFDVSVSAARHEDMDALLASVHGLFLEDGGRHDPAMDTDWATREGPAYYAGLLADPACLLLLARTGGHLVGHLAGKLVEPGSVRRTRLAVLESMRVHPDHRGAGIGGLLVDAFLAWARGRGAAEASVTAFAANDGARRFYARHGFAPKSITFRAPL